MLNFEYKAIGKPVVIDGDTMDVVFDLGFSITTKQRVRLISIDTPELNSFDLEVRTKAIEAKKFAIDWIDKNLSSLTIKTYKDDKYGRILAEFRSAQFNTTLNQELLEAGLAKPYFGGPK
jgi:endonuclease YncB( thermonuclease family)